MTPHPWIRRVRMRLRRHDGRVFLDRWGIQIDRLGGILLHRMTAPDPGIDLHDHPWAFTSLVLAGGYTEERAPCRQAPQLAQQADEIAYLSRGEVQHRHRWSIRALRLDECHRIVDLDGRVCWTLVVHGPRRRSWGFYLPSGWVDEHVYDLTVRSERRDLWNETV